MTKKIVSYFNIIRNECWKRMSNIGTCRSPPSLDFSPFEAYLKRYWNLLLPSYIFFFLENRLLRLYLWAWRYTGPRVRKCKSTPGKTKNSLHSVRKYQHHPYHNHIPSLIITNTNYMHLWKCGIHSYSSY